MEDCYAALKYLKDHADELGCNRDQIMVGGESAGGRPDGGAVYVRVDVYRTGLHAFDMLLPFRNISRQAIGEFKKQFLYATKHYFAPQDS